MIDFVLPSLGADMDEGMLVGWLVEPGDEVEYGQIIAEVETEKGIIEIECWYDGVIEEILRQPGPEKLPVGTSLARIRPSTEKAEPSPSEPRAPTPSERRPPARPPTPPPPVRHLAHTLGVDLSTISGTGPDGVVTREDIQEAAARAAGATLPPPPAPARAKASPRARHVARRLGVDLTRVVAGRADGLITRADVESAPTGADESEDRISAMRRAITRSMTRSKREIQRILPAVLLLKATALAVREVPALNGHFVDDRFDASDRVHLGVAISLREGGLVAPAIHDADRLDLDELMDRLRDLVRRARSWRLRGSEMSDPTITVTNLGDRGVETAFPVIIPPQVAMVGFGKVNEAVVPEDGSPAVHPIVHASLAGDHRVTDGHTGGLLLGSLDRLLQKPEAL